MGDWGEHGSTTGGYYKCNKYEAKDGDGDNDVAKAKAELDRYLHYYKRQVGWLGRMLGITDAFFFFERVMGFDFFSKRHV